MTYREARAMAVEELGRIESPSLEAELLLRHLTGWSRHIMLLRLGEEMPRELSARYLGLVRRRMSREPLQHITGNVDFMGREFHAGPGALVPRPETETLTDLFVRGLHDPGLLLDAGTGSGVVAVTVALTFPAALVIGSDVSREALSLAVRNRDRYGACNLLLVMGDLLQAFRPGGTALDGIVANLPYVPSREIDDLEPEVSMGDPRLALDGGDDGLDLVREFLASAHLYMRDGGLLALELDTEQVRPVHGMLKECGYWTSTSMHEDLTGRDRFVTARRMGTEAF
ncbi:MAG: peptide chain release factor N(5)-glutamine methyltransferase [Candidatus Fermentibacteraceae bacterium]|nr:peptide chain release factor N(5)-glutamine methyltransferase [Candidatus Fermentibacteraceae bacterium]MBN2608178.1 peptide chain release factor N(5)-glutamine methyltransferase [Candidatus Fermentibacteraceae bacterium]